MNLQVAPGRALTWIGRERRVLQAGAVSVALHLVVLWPTTIPPVRLHLAQPLVARLTEVTVRAGGSDADAPALPPSAPVPRPMRQAARTEPPAARPEASRRPAAMEVSRKPGGEASWAVVGSGPPLPPADAPAASTGVAVSPAGETSLALAAVGAVTAKEAASDLPAEGADPQALVAYRFALRHAVIRHYPDYARERGWSGTAEVRVTVAQSGSVREVRLTRSTGYRPLDEEARSMLALAARRAAVPEPLRGREFSVDVPIIFSLQDAEPR